MDFHVQCITPSLSSHVCLSTLPHLFVSCPLDVKQYAQLAYMIFQDRPCSWRSVIARVHKNLCTLGYSCTSMSTGSQCYMCSSLQSCGPVYENHHHDLMIAEIKGVKFAAHAAEIFDLTVCCRISELGHVG